MWIVMMMEKEGKGKRRGIKRGEKKNVKLMVLVLEYKSKSYLDHVESKQ